MTQLSALAESTGILEPGLPDQPHTANVLAGRTRYAHALVRLLPPAGLPLAECHRTGPVVKSALAVGHEAITASKRDVATLATVSSPSGGGSRNYSAICEVLTEGDCKLSSTRFHNSVHNAPVGYWSIAIHAMAPSNVLCAYDGSFVADLLDGLCQAAIDATPMLVIAYDDDYPEPLNAVHPMPDPPAVALMSAPETGPRTLACTDVVLTDVSLATLTQPGLKTLWHGNVAAHMLSLLEVPAARCAGHVVLGYLYETRAWVDITLGMS